MKVTKKIKQSFDAYNRFGYELSLPETYRVDSIEESPNGLETIEWFIRRDVFGEKNNKCLNKKECCHIVKSKAYLNFMIDLWAEGCGKSLSTTMELANDFPYLPSWVRKAVNNAKWKYREKDNKDILYNINTNESN